MGGNEGPQSGAACAKMDLLFIVDDTGSMKAGQARHELPEVHRVADFLDGVKQAGGRSAADALEDAFGKFTAGSAAFTVL